MAQVCRASCSRILGTPAGCAQRTPEVAQAVGMVGAAGLIADDMLAGAIVGPQRQPLGLLHGRRTTQCRRKRGRQWQRPRRAVGLRCAVHRGTVHRHPVVRDRQRARVQVDIRPPQAADLAAAQPDSARCQACASRSPATCASSLRTSASVKGRSLDASPPHG